MPVQRVRWLTGPFSIFAEEVGRVSDAVKVVAGGALYYDWRGEMESDTSGVVED